MARWSRVFSYGNNASGCCPSACYNYISANPTCGESNILSEFPPEVQSLAQAMEIATLDLKHRVNASDVSVQALDANTFIVSMRLTSRTRDVATINVRAINNTSPVMCDYTYRKDAQSGSFGTISSMVSWLAVKLGI